MTTTMMPPRSLTITIRMPASIMLAQSEVQEGVTALLFHDGRMSHREACDLLGLDRRGFDAVLAAHGFTAADRLDPSDEIEAAKAW